MKKLFKILAWIIFILVLFLIGIGWFFNRKYGQATQDLKAAKSELVDKVANFRQSEVNTNPEVELPLLPVPKSVVWKEGTFIWPKEWEIKGTASVLPQVKQWANRLLKNEPNATRATAQIRLIPKENLSQEGYELTILANAIEIHYQTSAGLYYGMVTLHQLQILFPNSINQIHIADEPDLAIRGVMLDISRDKVPKLSTLKEIVDKLSLLKYGKKQKHRYYQPKFRN